eukprot:gene11150-biopygen5413
MNVRDPSGRRAMDVATPVHRKVMEDRHRFLRRYELKEGRDWPQLRVITQQIVEAAGHMHSKGLIHEDIKPLNITYKTESSSGEPVLEGLKYDLVPALPAT